MADRSLVVRIVGDSSSLERSFARSSNATRQFDRNFTSATRGVLAGTGVFRSFGRTLAFASGGFLAFGSASAFLRKSVDAAKEAQVANAQLATQLSNSGKSFEAYRGQIDKTIFRLSALAGIEDDELKAGLTTILRTVPDVSKALRDLATATDLARARHISLSQAATIIAKTEAGNTTLLRRQGFQIKQNATAEQALAQVRAVVAGQAAAGTTQQERFGAVLHQTEEIIGQGILPTLNKYLESGSRWLEQMNQSGKLQKDVARAAEGFAGAMTALADAVKTVDRFTGGFKHTLEILVGLKLASWAAGVAQNIGLIGASARTATERAVLLRGALTKLAGLGVITIGIEVLLNKKTIDNKVSNFLDDHGLGFLGGNNRLPTKGLNLGNIDQAIAKAQKIDDGLLAEALKKYKQFLNSQDAKAASKLSAVQGAGPHGAALLAQKIAEDAAAVTKSGAKGLTATQRNTFFDNTISRILLRGGLGDIKSQIAALQKADALIDARLKVTKDVTRRLNLEDQLLQNQAQIKTLRGQQTADALQKQQDARQKAIDALAASAAARNARQFQELGLTASGDERTPGVAGLKKRLQQLTANVNASSLNTPKLQTELARFRKVLSEGLVGQPVRAKIKEGMDQIADLLKQSTEKVTKNLTRFRHVNANEIVGAFGGDLTADQKRRLRQVISQIGSGGTVPGGSSPSFAAAGALNVVVQAPPVYLDGKKISQNTTAHQRRQNQRRTDSRRGPYAGRH